MKEAPIKRSKHLLPISREHHFGLLFSWKIRQGIKLKVDSRRIVRYIRDFWQYQLKPHFTEEETLLFLDRSDSLVQKALEEHVLIEQKICEILQSTNGATASQINTLVNEIDNHIRFEERTLFPHLEACFTETQFKKIDIYYQNSNSSQSKGDYNDEFWIHQKSIL